ncbi:MAG: response regulator transcription factor [Chloroflexi bacterium]|nr:response regulator transcription factor [Chloroflexota bacterium]MBU1749778.1 response regulator transcription factor [Chloroflexota bacterium]
MTTESSPPRILIIDDDPNLVDLLTFNLLMHGYQAFSAPDGTAGLHQIYDVRPDLVVLDISMPGLDGWEVCRRIRDMSDVPIIMLTGRGELGSRLRGLNLGADDYVAKPFDLEEFILRIEAVLRRSRRSAPAAKFVYYEDANLCVDEANQSITRSGQPICLTATEERLLLTLIKQIDEFVPYEELIATVWTEDDLHTRGHLKVLVSSLRHKIGDGNPAPNHILNRRSVGYCFQSRTSPNLDSTEPE